MRVDTQNKKVRDKMQIVSPNIAQTSVTQHSHPLVAENSPGHKVCALFNAGKGLAVLAVVANRRCSGIFFCPLSYLFLSLSLGDFSLPLILRDGSI